MTEIKAPLVHIYKESKFIWGVVTSSLWAGIMCVCGAHGLGRICSNNRRPRISAAFWSKKLISAVLKYAPQAWCEEFIETQTTTTNSVMQYYNSNGNFCSLIVMFFSSKWVYFVALPFSSLSKILATLSSAVSAVNFAGTTSPTSEEGLS